MTHFERAKQLQAQMVQDRRWLHQHAERGLDLPETTNYVFHRLEQMGYTPKWVGKSGIVAVVGGKKAGKTILLRADMDALPIIEESGEAFSSLTEYAHCCGHDLHTAYLLGAAQMLKEQEDTLEGTVKLMFQPGEETGNGAKTMIESGVLTDVPRPDCAVGTHVFSSMPTGTVGTRKGVMMASSDALHITVQGKGGHGSTPETAVDPIHIGVQIYLALQEIISREISYLDNAVLTIGRFTMGSAFNIIPDSGIMQGSLRCLNETTRSFILSRCKEMVEQVGKTYRGSARFEVEYSLPTTQCDAAMVDYTEKVLAGMPDANLTFFEVDPISGSEDFSYVTQQIPSVFLGLGAQAPENHTPYPQHHPKVVFDENVLPIGAAIFTEFAVNWLKDNQ